MRASFDQKTTMAFAYGVRSAVCKNAAAHSKENGGGVLQAEQVKTKNPAKMRAEIKALSQGAQIVLRHQNRKSWLLAYHRTACLPVLIRCLN